MPALLQGRSQTRGEEWQCKAKVEDHTISRLFSCCKAVTGSYPSKVGISQGITAPQDAPALFSCIGDTKAMAEEAF